METLDVFVADPVSKSFIRIIHGILVFFQVSFPSTVYIHLPATLELGIIYTLLYTDILISSHVPAVNPTVAATHQSFRNPAQQLAFNY